MTRTTTIAVSADYADALLTARRAKNLLFLLLILILLAQVALFFLVKFNILHLTDRAGISQSAAPTGPAAAPAPAPVTPAVPSDVTTLPADALTATTAPTTAPAAKTADAVAGPVKGPMVAEILQYALPVINFLGVTLSIVLAVVLLLLTGIMLVGRLVGVSHVTSAFIWSVLLVVFLFPWQAFLVHTGNYPVRAVDANAPGGFATVHGDPEQPAFKFPGVLYTYPELRQDYDFQNQPIEHAVIKWARYAAFPLVAVLVLLMVHAKSRRGLRFALGESEIQVEVTRQHDPLV